MAISYVPEQKEYKKLKPFNRFVLQNFPFIDADFDALTNYELLAKVIEYLNEVIENENVVSDNVKNLYDGFIELQNYVNNYFDNLDVQENINVKLDEMAESGQLAEIINEQIFDDLNQRIANDELLIQGNTDEIQRVDEKVDANETESHLDPYYDVFENGGSDDGSEPIDSLISTAKTNGYFKFYFKQNTNKNAVYYFTNAPQFNGCQILTDDGVVLSVPSAEMIAVTSTASFDSNIKFLLRSSNEYMILPKNKSDFYNMLHINNDYRIKSLQSGYGLTSNEVKMYHYKYNVDFLWEEVPKATYYQESGTMISRKSGTGNSYFNGLCALMKDSCNTIQTVTNGSGANLKYAIVNSTTGEGIFAGYGGSSIYYYYNNASSSIIEPLNIDKHTMQNNSNNSYNTPMIWKMRYDKAKNKVYFMINSWIAASLTLPFTPDYWGFGLDSPNDAHQFMRFSQYYQESIPLNYNLKILIVGDSRFYGNGQTYKIDEVLKNGLLYNGINKVDIDNLSVSGYTLSQINSLLMDTDLSQYDIVIYEGGINNYNSDLNTIANTLGNITNYLNSSGCIVIYTTCMPCGYGGTDPVADARALAYYGIVNAMYVGIGAFVSDKNIIIDNNLGNTKYDSNIPVCSDGVHPNDNGIIEISRNIISAIFNHYKI